MLKSLRSISKGERAAVLASSIRQLTESPFDSVRLQDRRWNEVIIDAAKKAGTSLNNATDRDFLNIRSVLADELRRVILPPESVAKVRERVGQKGLFHTSKYDLSFSKEFREHENDFLVSAKEVQWAVRRPDRFDHLKIDGKDDSALTLVARLKNSPNPHWVLAIFRRAGNNLQCVTAWMIPFAVVDYTPATEALELLRGFVSVYGVKLRIGAEENDLFVYAMLPPPAEVSIRSTENINICMFAKPAEGGVEVALAYAIKSDEYAESLRKHGLI